jgi:predicted nuclease of predicted toxin-antitoxin system
MNQGTSITFFIDRCLGNKRIVEVLKQAGIHVEIHDDHFPKNAQDVDWLPQVGERGWVILTKDSSISKNKLERIAVTNANIKMFILASQKLSGEDMANIFLLAIVKMQALVYKNQAPFIAKIYRDGRVEMWKDRQSLLDEII